MSEVTLDANLWSSLPGELFFLVLARLSARSFCRLRSVCRRWNHLPSSSQFRKPERNRLCASCTTT